MDTISSSPQVSLFQDIFDPFPMHFHNSFVCISKTGLSTIFLLLGTLCDKSPLYTAQVHHLQNSFVHKCPTSFHPGPESPPWTAVGEVPSGDRGGTTGGEEIYLLTQLINNLPPTYSLTYRLNTLPFYMLLTNLPNLHTYLFSYLYIYIHKYLLIYLPTYILTHLSNYLPT